MDKRINRLTSRKITDFLINNSLFIAIAVLTIITAVLRPNFLKAAPLNLLNRTAAYVMMALGMGCVMLIGGIDLSAGRIMGLTAIIATLFLSNVDPSTKLFPEMGQLSVSTVFILVILVGVLVGCINGLFVEKFKLHPYIVTLCVQLMIYGTMLICLGFAPNTTSGISILIPEYKDLITNTVKIGPWEIPYYVCYATAVVILMWVVWKFTPLGKKMRMIGENYEAAKTLNINSMAITVATFAIAGMLFATNGFIEAARVGGTGASAGLNAEFDAIAACLMGGVSMKGGIGKIGGIVIGVILFQLITICLQWLSVSANYVYIIKGGLIIWAVAMDARKNYAGSGPAIWKWK